MIDHKSYLALIRETLGLSQAKMGAFFGMVQSNYARLENKKSPYLSEKVIRSAEIHLKVNRIYLQSGEGDMFNADDPLYSTRINKVCVALNVNIDKISVPLEPDDKRLLRAVMDNAAIPAYELCRRLFASYPHVNINYILDAVGSPLISDANDPSQNFYQRYDGKEATLLFRDALRAYQSISNEKDMIIQSLKSDVERLKQELLDCMNKKT